MGQVRDHTKRSGKKKAAGGRGRLQEIGGEHFAERLARRRASGSSWKLSLGV